MSYFGRKRAHMIELLKLFLHMWNKQIYWRQSQENSPPDSGKGQKHDKSN